MQDIMSIDRFHAALASSKSDTPLMIALRQVKTIKGPERMALRIGHNVSPNFVWTGWNV